MPPPKRNVYKVLKNRCFFNPFFFYPIFARKWNCLSRPPTWVKITTFTVVYLLDRAASKDQRTKGNNFFDKTSTSPRFRTFCECHEPAYHRHWSSTPIIGTCKSTLIIETYNRHSLSKLIINTNHRKLSSKLIMCTWKSM